jgi:hypothetical protein
LHEAPSGPRKSTVVAFIVAEADGRQVRQAMCCGDHPAVIAAARDDKSTSIPNAEDRPRP